MKKNLLALVLCLCTLPGAAQTAAFSTVQIDSIVHRIDTSCISGGITDFTIRKKGRRKTIAGSGADWFYTNKEGNTLLKVVQELSMEMEYFFIYYFYHDSLIYVFTKIRSYKSDSITKNREGRLYYRNDTLLAHTGNMAITLKPEYHVAAARQFFGAAQIWRRRGF